MLKNTIDWLKMLYADVDDTTPELIKCYYYGWNEAVSTLVYALETEDRCEKKIDELKKTIEELRAEPKEVKAPKEPEEEAIKPPKRQQPKKLKEPKSKKPIDKGHIASLRSQGKTFDQIAEIYGCGRSTVYRAYQDYLKQFE